MNRLPVLPPLPRPHSQLTIVARTGSSSVLSPVYRVSSLTPPQDEVVDRGALPIRPESAGAGAGAGACECEGFAGETGCGAKERASRSWSSSSAWLGVSGGGGGRTVAVVSVGAHGGVTYIIWCDSEPTGSYAIVSVVAVAGAVCCVL
jgi:hypothetical protein